MRAAARHAKYATGAVAIAKIPRRLKSFAKYRWFSTCDSVASAKALNILLSSEFISAMPACCRKFALLNLEYPYKPLPRMVAYKPYCSYGARMLKTSASVVLYPQAFVLYSSSSPDRRHSAH